MFCWTLIWRFKHTSNFQIPAKPLVLYLKEFEFSLRTQYCLAHLFFTQRKFVALMKVIFNVNNYLQTFVSNAVTYDLALKWVTLPKPQASALAHPWVDPAVRTSFQHRCQRSIGQKHRVLSHRALISFKVFCVSSLLPWTGQL